MDWKEYWSHWKGIMIGKDSQTNDVMGVTQLLQDLIAIDSCGFTRFFLCCPSPQDLYGYGRGAHSECSKQYGVC